MQSIRWIAVLGALLCVPGHALAQSDGGFGHVADVRARRASERDLHHGPATCRALTFVRYVPARRLAWKCLNSLPAA